MQKIIRPIYQSRRWCYRVGLQATADVIADRRSTVSAKHGPGTLDMMFSGNFRQDSIDLAPLVSVSLPLATLRFICLCSLNVEIFCS